MNDAAITFIPWPGIKTRWVKTNRVPDRPRFGKFSQVIDVSYYQGTGGNVKGSDGRWRMTEGKVAAIKVAYVRDHPFLRETLSSLKHVPRAVKSIYLADVRLGFHKATDAFPVVRAMDAAHNAWREYAKTARDNG